MKINVIKRERLWWASSVFIIAFGLIAMAVSWSIIGTPLKPSLDFIFLDGNNNAKSINLCGGGYTMNTLLLVKYE